MSAKTFVLAAAFLAASAQAGSTVGIKNSCPHPIYIFKRQGSGATGGKITKQTGETLEEECAGEAVNYMVHSKNTDDPCGPSSPCTQLEYSENSMMFYDMSNINGNPFAQGGMNLVPDVPSCPKVKCAPGQETCQDAYNNPDDVRTLTCQSGCRIILETCPTGQGGDGGDGGNSSGGGSQGGDSGNTTPPSYSPPSYSPPKDLTGGKKEVSNPSGNTGKSGGQQYDGVKENADGSIYSGGEGQGQGNDQGGDGQGADATVTQIATAYKYVNAKRAAETEAPKPIERRHLHAHRHAHGGAHFRA